MPRIKYVLEDNRVEKTKDNGLIFIHGATGCNLTWRYQLSGLASRIKVIAVDLPGHLESEGPEAPTLETYVEGIDELVESLRLTKVILGGHSMGGAVTLAYYLRYPEKVHGLVLIGTGARLRVLPIILKLAKTNYPEMIKMMGTAGFHKDTVKHNPELIEEESRYKAQIPSNIAYHDFKICDEFDIMTRLGEIKVPCLIICGDDDKMTPIKYSRFMDERIEVSECHILERAGHMVMLEKPDEVNSIIAQFLEKYDF